MLKGKQAQVSMKSCGFAGEGPRLCMSFPKASPVPKYRKSIQRVAEEKLLKKSHLGTVWRRGDGGGFGKRIASYRQSLSLKDCEGV